MATAVASALEHLPGTGRGGKAIRVPARVTLGELTVNNVGTLRKLNQVLFPVAYSDKFYKDVLDPEVSPEDYSKLIFYQVQPNDPTSPFPASTHAPPSQDLAVGNIVCRLEPASSPLPTTISTSISPVAPPVPSTSSATPVVPKQAAKASTEPQKLYIMTLGVLRPYRRQGLASKMLQHIIETAEASHRPPPEVVAPPAKKAVDPKDKKADKPKPPPAPKPVISSLYLHVQVSNDEARRFWEKNGFKVVGTVENYYRKIEPRNAWVLERVVGE
ncbi:hypothetical protein RQP46_006509 [Phenoliferia psychrophenolica]